MNKKIALILILVFSLLLSGCSLFGGDEETIDTSSVLLSIGDEKITVNQAIIFLEGQKSLIDDNYGSDIWDVELAGASFGNYLQGKLKSRIALVFAGALLAKSKGYELSSNDMQLVSSASDYYFNKLSSQAKSSLKISQSDIYNLFYSYRLSYIGYENLLESEELEVSEDEARVARFYRIALTISGLDASAIVDKKATLNEALEKAQAGEDFYTLASSYSEITPIEYVVSRDDVDGREEELLFNMVTDEISSVFENEEQIAIFKCVNSYDESLSAVRREELISEKKSGFYTGLLSDYIEQNPLYWNDDLWESLDINNISYNLGIGFYDVYDMFFPGE